jgi:hypothetical protein
MPCSAQAGELTEWAGKAEIKIHAEAAMMLVRI